MAKINDGTLKDWKDGDKVTADLYEADREILRAAINDTDSKTNANTTTASDHTKRITDLEYNVTGTVVPMTFKELGMQNLTFDDIKLGYVDKQIEKAWQPMFDSFVKGVSEDFTATDGQTVFTTTNGYTTGTSQIMVEVDGVPQDNSSFTETDGHTVTLSEPLVAGQKVRVTIGKVQPNADARFSSLTTQLAKRISLMQFENLKVAVSGGWDYGPCLQAAIDSLAPDTTNGYYYPQTNLGGSQPTDSKPGGIVVLPPGVFPMSNVKLRSHVSVEGSGKYATRIQPLGTSGYVFSTANGTSSPTLLGVSGIHLRDFMIAPSWNTYGVDSVRPSVGGIKLKDCFRDTNIQDVSVYNLSGDAFVFDTVFDSIFENLTAMECGGAGFRLNSDTLEVSNANKFIGCRSERNGILLVEDCATGGQVRQNQYIACKFEASDSISGSASIQLTGSWLSSFDGCMFVPNSTDYMFKVNSNTYDTRGISITGSTAIASAVHVAKFIDATLGTTATISGCSFSGVGANAFIGNVAISSSSFMDCSVGMFGTGVLIGTANQFKATHNGTTNSDTNGNYHKLGSMIQGGNMDNIQTGGTVITFPIPFPNGIVSVVAMVVNSGSTGATPYVLEAESISKTGFTLKSDFSGVNAHYIAVGY